MVMVPLSRRRGRARTAQDEWERWLPLCSSTCEQPWTSRVREQWQERCSEQLRESRVLLAPFKGRWTARLPALYEHPTASEQTFKERCCFGRQTSI